MVGLAKAAGQDVEVQYGVRPGSVLPGLTMTTMDSVGAYFYVHGVPWSVHYVESVLCKTLIRADIVGVSDRACPTKSLGKTSHKLGRGLKTLMFRSTG